MVALELGHCLPCAVTSGIGQSVSSSTIGSKMQPKITLRGVTKRQIAFLAVLLVLIGSIACFADQLQWNSRGVCKRAIRLIRPGSILISYCSLADNEHIEVWLVKEVDAINTPIEGLFEVFILGKRLYTSKKAFSSGEYRESVDYIEYKPVDQCECFYEAIDLAYVYIHAGTNSFQCLGKVLGLECLVEIEKIHLPDDLMEQLTSTEKPNHLMNLHGISLYPSWDTLNRGTYTQFLRLSGADGGTGSCSYWTGNFGRR